MTEAYHAIEPMDEFYCLTLPIAGCSDLYEALDRFTAAELLSWSSRYRSEEHRLQDALIQTSLLDATSILLIASQPLQQPVLRRVHD